MTAREELAVALYNAIRSGSNGIAWSELGSRSQKYWLDIADALLASPALAALIREKQAEARQEIADAWQWGEWTVLTKPIKNRTGPAQIIAAAQAVTDWLRARADQTETEEALR